jgi:hypothetical protein
MTEITSEAIAQRFDLAFDLAFSKTSSHIEARDAALRAVAALGYQAALEREPARLAVPDDQVRRLLTEEHFRVPRAIAFAEGARTREQDLKAWQPTRNPYAAEGEKSWV